jgi:riboflavin kinase / FMN adenylyltransferase
VRGVVAALGTFDGVHLGHRAVLRRAVEEGKRRETRVVAVTFDPHPRAVLRREERVGLLTTLELRREALLRYGADEVHVIRFDENLSRKSPEEFVREVLVGEVGAEVVVVGESFRFGHRAAGDLEALEAHMRAFGGAAVGVGILRGGGGAEISSTRIRELLFEGDVRGASVLLGRPYVLRGEVVRGEGRGRSIGFPTANVVADGALVVPARGVYAGLARLVGEPGRAEEREYAACTNIGLAPTFGRGESRVEAHLLDYEGDLYGRVLDVSFVERMRAEKRFSGVEELVEQIGRDVEAARRSVGGWRGACGSIWRRTRQTRE